jgi:hypothetical protein
MISALRVKGCTHWPSDWPCTVEVDDYVPCRFRTYEAPFGASYLQVGDFGRSLLELLFEPHTGLVRGVTLTSFETLAEQPEPDQLVQIDGLPLLDLAPTEAFRLEFRAQLKVSVVQNLLVYWGEIGSADMLVGARRLGFYIRGDVLLGLRVTGLSASQRERIAAHAASRRRW